jgi:cation diffusion facilitator CzcD-associated flavoprotein CzcO
MKQNYLDVIVVGAGISGIGAGAHLNTKCPDKTYAIFEGRENFGGTWDLFKYPGIRSDSDMHTLGFSFKPWNHKKSIATGPLIMEYLEETIEEYGLNEKIKYNHHVESANFFINQNFFICALAIIDILLDTNLNLKEVKISLVKLFIHKNGLNL